MRGESLRRNAAWARRSRKTSPALARTTSRRSRSCCKDYPELQDEVAKLEESDLVELMNLYKHVQGDLVLGAVLNWGKRREEGAFRNQFR